MINIKLFFPYERDGRLIQEQIVKHISDLLNRHIPRTFVSLTILKIFTFLCNHIYFSLVKINY